MLILLCSYYLLNSRWIFLSFFWKHPFAKASWVILNSHTFPCVGKGNPKVSKNSQPFLLPFFYFFNTYLSYIMAKLIDSSLITLSFLPLMFASWWMASKLSFLKPLCACSWFSNLQFLQYFLPLTWTSVFIIWIKICPLKYYKTI